MLIERLTSSKMIDIARIRAELQAETDVTRVEELTRKLEALKVAVGRTDERRDYITEVSIWANRRLGEMLRQMAEDGSRVKRQGRDDLSCTLQLKDLGIEKTKSARCQQLARAAEEIITTHITECKAKGRDVTLSGAIAAASGKRIAASSSTGEIEWYTPPDIIELARKVLGKIDTDPASNAVANEYIKATTFYTKEDDGLAHDWHGNVWMNPPYAAGLVSKFTSHLESQWQDKNVKQAIVLLNNSTDTQWFASLVKHASACCFKTGRIAFVSQDGEQVAGAAQGQVFLYFGKRKLKFNQVFADVGWIAEVSQ